MNDPSKADDTSETNQQPLLFRVLARGLTPPQTLVTREEAMELLPSCCSPRWFDENVKRKQVAFIGERALYRWGDVTASLVGAGADVPRGEVPENKRYLTIDEAAAYLRYSSTNALRMAVTRKQIVPSARRGRGLLFTREDLDRQIARGAPQNEARENTPPPQPATDKIDDLPATEPAPEPQPTTIERRQRTRARPPQDRSSSGVHDPYGLREALARARGEPWPPPPKPGRKPRRR